MALIDAALPVPTSFLVTPGSCPAASEGDEVCHTEHGDQPRMRHKLVEKGLHRAAGLSSLKKKAARRRLKGRWGLAFKLDATSRP